MNIDYHVAFEGHYYLVSHQQVGAAVELRVTAAKLEVLLRRQRIAAHARSAKAGGFTTETEHMPASHRAHRQWTPAKLIACGERIGAATGAVVRWQMEHRLHPEQSYRCCLGLMRLAREFGDERLEAACARALSIRAPSYRLFCTPNPHLQQLWYSTLKQQQLEGLGRWQWIGRGTRYRTRYCATRWASCGRASGCRFPVRWGQWTERGLHQSLAHGDLELPVGYGR